ncbi:hypothetical protein SteCoe_26178 [Stentor coeruleus]|uniref:Uncharacterized protein n=1 Tax=Stentor coeruleus TaxID=5963 RepID=A0A1R2BDG7_9CILI|nr:hypothetical protein SteCoe_26178 [Stentor coeruleus]
MEDGGQEEIKVEMFMYLSDNDEPVNLQQVNDDSLVNNSFSRNDLNSRSSTTQGRHKIPFTKKLESFQKEKDAKKPKKENINIAFIRTIKKIFKCIQNGKILSKSRFSIDNKCDKDMRIWGEIEEIYRENPVIIGKIITDGINRYYKNDYCNKFFSNIYMQKAFIKLIELTFINCTCSYCQSKGCNYCHNINCNSRGCNHCRNINCSYCRNINCSLYCSKFKFYCCANGKKLDHSDSCKLKWNDLEHYFLEFYLKDLGVKVFP